MKMNGKDRGIRRVDVSVTYENRGNLISRMNYVEQEIRCKIRAINSMIDEGKELDEEILTKVMVIFDKIRGEYIPLKGLLNEMDMLEEAESEGACERYESFRDFLDEFFPNRVEDTDSIFVDIDDLYPDSEDEIDDVPLGMGIIQRARKIGKDEDEE